MGPRPSSMTDGNRATYPRVLGHTRSITVNRFWSPCQMNLTLLSAHANRGVRPSGVVEVEVVSHEQDVVRLVLVLRYLKWYLSRSEALAFLPPMKWRTWYETGRTQSLLLSLATAASAAGAV